MDLREAIVYAVREMLHGNFGAEYRRERAAMWEDLYAKDEVRAAKEVCDLYRSEAVGLEYAADILVRWVGLVDGDLSKELVDITARYHDTRPQAARPTIYQLYLPGL